MQIIDVYDSNYETAAAKLKDALMQYASGYFDSYDTDFPDNFNRIVQCKIGQTAAVEFVYRLGSPYFQLRAGGKVLSPSINAEYRFCYLYVFENAIQLVYKSVNSTPAYNMPILLCKKKNGDTALAFFTNATVTNIAYTNTTTLYSCVLNVSRSTGAADFSVLPTAFAINNTGSVTGFSLFSLNDGNLLKDVFLVIDSDFRSHAEPFAYTLNNVTYTGIAGNYLAVKGT